MPAAHSRPLAAPDIPPSPRPETPPPRRLPARPPLSHHAPAQPPPHPHAILTQTAVERRPPLGARPEAARTPNTRSAGSSGRLCSGSNPSTGHASTLRRGDSVAFMGAYRRLCCQREQGTTRRSAKEAHNDGPVPPPLPTRCVNTQADGSAATPPSDCPHKQGCHANKTRRPTCMEGRPRGRKGATTWRQDQAGAG